LRYHRRIPVSPSRSLIRVSASLFGVALLIAAWIVGAGAAGWLYLLFYAIAVSPGLAAGFALFGRSPAGWISGAAIGYALTAVVLWAVIAGGAPSAPLFGVAWCALAAMSWVLARRSPGSWVALPAWTPRTWTSLVLVLVLTLAIAAPPLANVGRRDAAGNRYYRAYFTADFVWHTALTAELAKFAMPPRNPYLQQRPIHYYWTYYIFPAVVSARGPAPLRDVQLCLRMNALATALILMSTVFLAAWAAVGRAGAAGAGTALALAASGAEGVYALHRIYVRGAPLAVVRELNIDALTSWWLGGHRMDGLPRCLWYVPQHGMSYALGLVALAATTRMRADAPLRISALIGLAIGSSVLFNPFVGGIFAIVYGIAAVLAALRTGRPLAAIARQTIAAVPVVAAIAWCLGNQMLAGAGGVVRFGLLGASRHHPVLTLALGLGPILAVAVAGCIPSRSVSLRPLIPSMLAMAISLLALYVVQLSVDTEWVAFRTGHLILVAAAAPAAFFVARHWNAGRRRTALAGITLCIVAGLPTTIIDVYNARDIHNLEMGPGFPWTIVVTPQQQRAYQWLRNHTPETAIVQMDPTVRGRATWSNIPSFAERRMTAGLPISLLNVPEYRERSDDVARMYATTDAATAFDIARTLHIQYVYVDEAERAGYPGGIAFDDWRYFQKVFADGPVAIYRVR
jgi:hypothetical protein